MTVLCVEDLEKQYGERSVGPASFTLEAGEIGLVVGGSGSGKSTLLDLIYGTRTATAGKAILRLGDWRRDLLGLSVAERVLVRRSAIGYCTQFLAAIPGSTGYGLAREAEAPDMRPGEMERLFERLALPSRVWHLPVAAWSGGEKQRLNIALAVLRRPPLILLDEPLSSLDPALHPVVWSVLSDFAKEGAALLVGVHQAEDGYGTKKADLAGYRCNRQLELRQVESP